MANKTSRVPIWNTFFKLTWTEAKSLFEVVNSCTSQDEFSPLGGTLNDEQFHSLATLTLCTLAIEARANHLIDELVEKGVIGKAVGEAAQRLPAEQKWFLIPSLAGERRKIDANRWPHQTVKEICRRRNELMHVKYERLSQNLPPARKVLSLFQGFVEAMEDMNVILRRIKKSRKKVLEIGHFKCS